MSDTYNVEGAKGLQEELESGILSLKKLKAREASTTLINYQAKITRGTLDDLIELITGIKQSEIEEA